MDRETIKQIAQEVYDQNSASDQFAVATVGFHKHNGQDAPRFPFTNLSDVPDSYYGQKGRSIVVNSTENLLEFSGGVLALTATLGFLALPTCAGTPTGIPTIGRGATVYDTTANKIWIWNGTAWKFVTMT